jgi:hypothetical protein
MNRLYGPPESPPPAIQTPTGIQPASGTCKYCSGPINGPIFGDSFCSITCAGNHKIIQDDHDGCSCGGSCDKCSKKVTGKKIGTNYTPNAVIDNSITGTRGMIGGGPGAGGSIRNG